MSKHTPGPWKWAIGTGICATMVTCEQGLICELGGGDCAEANARLIAAAPDLLTACRRLRAKVCDNCKEATPDSCSGCQYLNEIQLSEAAIKKAGTQ